MALRAGPLMSSDVASSSPSPHRLSPSLWAPRWQDGRQPGRALSFPALPLVKERALLLMVWPNGLGLILLGPWPLLERVAAATPGAKTGHVWVYPRPLEQVWEPTSPRAKPPRKGLARGERGVSFLDPVRMERGRGEGHEGKSHQPQTCVAPCSGVPGGDSGEALRGKAGRGGLSGQVRRVPCRHRLSPVSPGVG